VFNVVKVWAPLRPTLRGLVARLLRFFAAGKRRPTEANEGNEEAMADAQAGHKKQKNWHGNCAYMRRMNERTCQPRHILVVDDELLVRQTVQMLLQSDGYVVDGAQSGAEALALFQPGKFDMIFTDYLMPGMKGDQLAAIIKRRSPEQPVVMLTAYPEKLQSSDCPLGGVDSFICKPFELETLRTAIARFAPG
jgi:CheY-like chemotaxis protein